MLGFLRRLLRPRDDDRFHYRAGTVRGSISPGEYAAALARIGTTAADLDAMLERFSISLQEANANRGRLEVLRHEVPIFQADAARLEPIVRAVFGLPPLDPETGRGATVVEAIGVLFSYSTWEKRRRLAELDRTG
jgi:hypothetical protein